MNNTELSLKEIQECVNSCKNNADLENFLASRFSDNFIALEKYFPDIAVYFKNYNPKQNIEFFCTENRIPNVYLPDSHQCLYPYTDPFEVCKKQVQDKINNATLEINYFGIENDPYGQISYKYCNHAVRLSENNTNSEVFIKDLETISNCLMLGCGLGYQLAYLYEQKEIFNLVLIEPDTDFFFSSLFTFDWANLLDYIHNSNLHIKIILESNFDRIYNELQQYYLSVGVFLTNSIFFYKHYSNKQINSLEKHIFEKYDFLNFGYGFFDDYIFGISHAYYSIKNNSHFVLQNKKLNEDYADYPVFIVGSGPSLDNDIDCIRKFQDKAIIIACGTGLDTLYHAGVKPDFYAVTERNPEILQAINVIPDKQFFSDITLLTTEVCHPCVVNKFKYHAIFGKNNEILIRYINDNYLSHSPIQEINFINPLVGNMGVAGAAYLGFRKIFLFGIDNGKKLGIKKMHSKFASLYNNHGCNDITGNYETKETSRGNFDGLCETNKKYLISAANISNIIKIFREKDETFTCYNCSDGIKITGSTTLHSENINTNIFKDFHFSKKEILNFINSEKTVSLSNLNLEKFWNGSNFSRIVSSLIESLNKKSDTRTEILKLLSNLSQKINFEINYNKNIEIKCLHGSITNLSSIVLQTIYAKNNKDGIANAQRIIALIQDFLTETIDIYAKLPNYIQGEHRKYYKDNKVGSNMPSCNAPLLPPVNSIIKTDYEDPIKKFVKKY